MALSLSDLVSRGCDLRELRDASETEVEELLLALGFESADDRAVLQGLLHRLPQDLSSDELASWASRAEASEAASGDEILARAEELKAQGNAHFKADELGRASTAYQGAIEVLTSPAGKKALEQWWTALKETADAADAATPLLVSLHTNLAAVHNKLGQWQMCVAAASSALALDASSVKARFRRGVAHSNLAQYDEAKADLTAVVRADPRNREARTVLEVVSAAIQERKKSEKELYSKAFQGPSLYAADEARERQRVAEEARRVAEEEAALLREWRAECARLRALAPAAVAVQASVAKRSGWKEMEEGMLVDSAAKGDPESLSALDKMAPISLSDFKTQREKAQQEARAAQQEAERRRRREAEAARTVSGEEAADEEEEELLKGLSKGYKKRADGTTTTFFDRQVDPATKALLDAQKAPRRIEADAAAAPAAAKVGSAWNTAGTWEETDASAWATAQLRSRLSGLEIEGASSIARGVRVASVKSIEGTASVITMRGKTRHPFEFKFELEWESESGEADGDAVKGVLSYSDVCPLASGGDAASSMVSYELAEHFTLPPTAEVAADVQTALTSLKKLVNEAVELFLMDFKQH
ncbi:hypothetical protein AB1Y20_000336 [Prymnesium parvum]|uniref:peptidylprolyl isomerase n=1 Tax=Prymnesium parvum TaxID=97485 RepID=A0AB34K628_PRYPA